MPNNNNNNNDITLATLPFITRETLAEKLKPSTSSPSPSLAIIDVRDADHIGGHIKGSTWVPSSTLEYKTPELVRTLRDKEVVVFHCALSQQRGPGAALRYLRERAKKEGGGEDSGEKKGEGEGEGDGKGEGEGEGNGKGQRVYVLKGGFTEWQEKYGEDGELTEGYEKDVWEFGS
ncbi:hypothetical protein HRS9139_03831 [Pyrenophora teres f. teres]|nr:hypothetical protein HRS9139_03831 [Pyrenophora teres f. teres]KAE8865439.1 hypothetical protein PTNB29_02586 [Pyrenophora teres f. teres]